MQMRRNPFVAALGEGRAQIGLWVSLSSNVAAEVVAPAGFDWALIDMEHSANDYFSVLSQLQVFAGHGVGSFEGGSDERQGFVGGRRFVHQVNTVVL